MAMTPEVEVLVSKIKTEQSAKKMRSHISDAVQLTNEKTEEVSKKQSDLKNQFHSVIVATTDKDVISAPEISASRVGADDKAYDTLKERLDSEKKESDFLTKNNKSNELEVIAHRGFSYVAPENTIASFTEAFNNDFDSLETDVQITSDGQAVCIHDRTLNRTTNGIGNVSDTTLSDVKNLDASKVNSFYSPSYIPTFKEYLDICKIKSRFIYPEIKSYRTIEDIKIMTDLIVLNGFENKCVLQSFKFGDLEKVRTLNDNITLGFLVGVVANFQTALDLAFEDGNAVLVVHYNILLEDESLIALATEKCIDLVVWVVDEAYDFERVKKIGIKRIMTNCNNRGL